MKGTRHSATQPTWAWLVSSGLIVALGAVGFSAWENNAAAKEHRADSQEIRESGAASLAVHDEELAQLHAEFAELEAERAELLAATRPAGVQLATSVVESNSVDPGLVSAPVETVPVAKKTAKKSSKSKSSKSKASKPKASKPKASKPEPTQPTKRIILPDSRDPLAGL